MRKFVGLLLAAVTMVATANETARAEDNGRIVVLISVDGLANFYRGDSRAEMPTIRALAAAGAEASSMQPCTPTVTWPNHTTLVTGVMPARHGVVGNHYFDRTTGKSVALISDPLFDKEQIVKSPTIYDVAKQHGMTTASIRWPATRNAKTLDWALPDVGTTALLRKYTTPALLAECEEAGIWSDGEALDSGTRDTKLVSDQVCTDIFNRILHKHRPQLALLHLINVDHLEHVKGPRTPEAYEAIKVADGQVREVWDELKRDFPDKATLIIVSDHGFSAIEKMILPNVVLRKAGLVQVENNRLSGGTVHVVGAGGSAMIYILDTEHRAATIEKVTKLLAETPGVAKVIGPEHLKDYGVPGPEIDPHGPDLVVFAEEGYSFSEKATGDDAISDKPSLLGHHGHDPNLPDLQATFIVWGADIKPGAKLGAIQNTQVAPTIAKLLGLEMPDVEGKPLDAALAK